MTTTALPWGIYQLFTTLREIPGHKRVHYCGTGGEGSFKMIDAWVSSSCDLSQLLTHLTQLLNDSSAANSLSIIVQHTRRRAMDDIDPKTGLPFTNVFSFACLRDELWRLPFYITEMCSVEPTDNAAIRYV
jgi:hypothetical protein